MTKVSDAKKALLGEIVQNVGTVVTRKQVLAFVKTKGGSIADVRWIFNNKLVRAGRGQYDLSKLANSNATDSTEETEPATATAA
jgi:pyruvate/2-oxoglutarate dehydrogenase complex dihydrolipoamide acyltransferase (E2) component